MIYQDEPKSNQEAFDRVWNTFVVEQKPRAIEGLGCRYRIGTDHGCAIGIQLPNSLYSSELEGKGAAGILGIGFLAVTVDEKLSAKLRKHFRFVASELLVDLQGAHDQGSALLIESNLRSVAEAWKLVVPTPDAH